MFDSKINRRAALWIGATICAPAIYIPTNSYAANSDIIVSISDDPHFRATIMRSTTMKRIMLGVTLSMLKSMRDMNPVMLDNFDYHAVARDILARFPVSALAAAARKLKKDANGDISWPQFTGAFAIGLGGAVAATGLQEALQLKLRKSYGWKTQRAKWFAWTLAWTSINLYAYFAITKLIEELSVRYSQSPPSRRRHLNTVKWMTEKIEFAIYQSMRFERLSTIESGVRFDWLTIDVGRPELSSTGYAADLPELYARRTVVRPLDDLNLIESQSSVARMRRFGSYGPNLNELNYPSSYTGNFTVNASNVPTVKIRNR